MVILYFHENLYLYICVVSPLLFDIPKASQERIAQLRRKMSNQANNERPEHTVPGAPHVAQEAGHFSAGNPTDPVVPQNPNPDTAGSTVATTVAYAPGAAGEVPVPETVPESASVDVKIPPPTEVTESEREKNWPSLWKSDKDEPCFPPTGPVTKSPPPVPPTPFATIPAPSPEEPEGVSEHDGSASTTPPVEPPANPYWKSLEYIYI